MAVVSKGIALLMALGSLSTSQAFAPRAFVASGAAAADIGKLESVKPSRTQSSRQHSSQLTALPPTTTTTSFFEALTIGNILITSALFSAGVYATVTQGQGLSSDDSIDVKDVEMPVINQQAQSLVQDEEPIQEQATEPHQLEEEVVEDLLLEVKKDPKYVPEKDFTQLKKNVATSMESIIKNKEPVPKPFDITLLKTEIGNTLEGEREKQTRALQNAAKYAPKERNLLDLNQQVQETQDVASGNTKSGRKRRLVRKIVKKMVMPWKKWDNL